MDLSGKMVQFLEFEVEGLHHSVPVVFVSDAEYNAIEEGTAAVDRWASHGLAFGPLQTMSLAVFLVTLREGGK